MSIEAMGWVYRHSPYQGAAFSVHMAVADSVNDQHKNELWMEQAKLAKKARVSRQSVNQSLACMEDDGFIRDLGPIAGQNRIRRFRFLFPDVPVIFETRFQDDDEVVASDDNRPRRGSLQVVASDDNGCQESRHRLSSQATLIPKEPKRTQEPSGGRAADAEPSPVPILIKHYVDCAKAHGVTPPWETRNAMGGAVKRLLKGGTPEADIRIALRWAADENKLATALAGLVMDVQAKRHESNGAR